MLLYQIYYMPTLGYSLPLPDSLWMNLWMNHWNVWWAGGSFPKVHIYPSGTKRMPTRIYGSLASGAGIIIETREDKEKVRLMAKLHWENSTGSKFPAPGGIGSVLYVTEVK